MSIETSGAAIRKGGKGCERDEYFVSDAVDIHHNARSVLLDEFSSKVSTSLRFHLIDNTDHHSIDR